MLFTVIIIVAVFVVAMACLYGFEIRANERRRERGEPPVKHHDITDQETEVYYIIGRK